jgi:hypothetical protein
MRLGRVLIGLAILTILGVPPVGAATRTVCQTGCQHARIQDAINFFNGSSGPNTVQVMTGYSAAASGETFPIQTLVIPANIAITGVPDGNGNLPTIAYTGPANGDVIIMVSPNSTVSNLRIVPGNANWVNRVIAAGVAGGAFGNLHLQGLTIQNVVVDFTATGNAGNGFDLIADNVTIRNSTIRGLAGNAVFVDGNNYTIQNNTLNGFSGAVPRSHIAIGFGADLKVPGFGLCAGFPTNYNITGNVISGFTEAAVKWCTGRNNTVSNNTISDIVDKAIETSGSLGTVIQNNVISWNTVGGVHAIGLSSNNIQACINNQVLQNQITGRAAPQDLQRGIVVQNCQNTVVTANILQNFADSDASIFIIVPPGAPTFTVVQGNTILNGNANGIAYFGADIGGSTGDASVIRDNVVINHRRNGLIVQNVKGAGNVVAYNIVRTINTGGFTNTHGLNLQGLRGTAFDRNEALDVRGVGAGFFLANSQNIVGTCNTGAANGGGLIAQTNVSPGFVNPVVFCRLALYNHFDFDGDGRSDIAVYRHQTSDWIILRSSDGQTMTVNFGCQLCDDIVAPGNYTLQNQTDIGVYRFLTGEWFIRQSTNQSVRVVAFGSPFLGDIPVPMDYDGDGRADIAVYRTSTSQWFVNGSTTGFFTTPWGCAACADLPVPGDYDGDGRADIGVYRRSTGEWFIRRSSDLMTLQVPYGSAPLGDLPVPGRYTVPGQTDIAIYRSLTGDWFIRRSTDLGTTQIKWGSPANGDAPVPADFTVAGTTDIAVYRLLGGGFFIRRSTDGSLNQVNFGSPAMLDSPLMAR